MRILERPVFPFYVCVDQVEFFGDRGEGEAGGPDTAGVGVPPHVEEGGPIEGPRVQCPVGEIGRRVDLDSRVPFEGAGCDVVGAVVQEDGGVGVEAWEDGVADLRHGS